MARAGRRPLPVVVLYSSGHLGSAVILNALARWREVEVVGVVRAKTVSLADEAGRAKAQQQLGRAGVRFAALLAWQRAVQRVGFALGRCMPWRRRLQAGWEIEQGLGLPALRSPDINGAEARAWLAARDADLFVSACFTQILREPAIALPRLGVLNVHPGWLPAQRGAMAYFWPLRREDPHGGASVHWIDAGIDPGTLLARRRVRVHRGLTQQQVMVRACTSGSRLLHRVVKQLARGRSPAASPVEAGEARYFPMPRACDFADYFGRRRFFRVRDVLGLLTAPARA